MNYFAIYFIIAVDILILQLHYSDCHSSAPSYGTYTSHISTPLRLESSPILNAVLIDSPKRSTHEEDVPSRSMLEPQLMVNIRVNPSFHIKNWDKFLILDEVYDPRKQARTKLLAPYLIEINRGEPVMMYPLEFQKNVKCEGCAQGKPSADPGATKISAHIHPAPQPQPQQTAAAAVPARAPASGMVTGKMAKPAAPNQKRLHNLHTQGTRGNFKRFRNNEKTDKHRNKYVIDKDSPSADNIIALEIENLPSGMAEKAADNSGGWGPNSTRQTSIIRKLQQCSEVADSKGATRRLPISYAKRRKAKGDSNRQSVLQNVMSAAFHSDDVAFDDIDDDDYTRDQLSSVDVNEEAQFDDNSNDYYDEMLNLNTKNDEGKYPNDENSNEMNKKTINHKQLQQSDERKEQAALAIKNYNYNLFSDFQRAFDGGDTKNGPDHSDKVESGQSSFEISNRGDDLPSEEKHYGKQNNIQLRKANSKANKEHSLRPEHFNTNPIHRDREEIAMTDSMMMQRKDSAKTWSESNADQSDELPLNCENNMQQSLEIQDPNQGDSPIYDEMQAARNENGGANYMKDDEILFDVQLKGHSQNENPLAGNLSKSNEKRTSSVVFKPDIRKLIPKYYQLPLSDQANDLVIDELVPTPTPVPLNKKLEQILMDKHSKYLPVKGPYAAVFQDPHLHFKDKYSLIDVVDRYDAEKEEQLRNMQQMRDRQEPLRSHAKLMGIQRSRLSNERESNEKPVRDYRTFDEREWSHAGQQFSKQRHVEPDVQPCNSCGGKGKKPKTDSNMANTREIPCNCAQQNGVCMCHSHRMQRAVSPDISYSMFNMSAPLPFLTTKVSVYRKRRNSWWKIAPTMTVTSLSAIFANSNLSILFSSHVDIFQLEKSLRLQHQQLLLPTDQAQLDSEVHINPQLIFALESDEILKQKRKPFRNDIPDYSNNKWLCDHIKAALSENYMNIHANRQITTDSKDAVRFRKTINDLGTSPHTMSMISVCPHQKNQLCLNLVDDKVPAFNIKLKIPFRENTIVDETLSKAKIVSIVTDATTKDALQIMVEVINYGLYSQDFSISIENCPTAYEGSTKTAVEKRILPHIGETVSFLLPFLFEATNKHKKIFCSVIVTAHARDPNAKKNKPKRQPTPHSTSGDQAQAQHGRTVVAMRDLAVEQESRCLCVWECNCHCIRKVETHVDYNVCKKLTPKEEMQAGLIPKSFSTQNEVVSSHIQTPLNLIGSQIPTNLNVLVYILLILIFLLALGTIKAILGLCICKINKLGYECVQPGSLYCEASGCRRFLVNVFFFLICPFALCCKCCMPAKEDVLVASTEWHCSVVQEKMDSSNKDYALSDNCSDIDDDEEDIFTQNDCERIKAGSEVLFKRNDFLDLPLDLSESVFDMDDSDENENTKYVLQALAESRECLKKLAREHVSSEILLSKDNMQLVQAKELVNALMEAQIVYRIFDTPMGNLTNIPPQTKYSIQGYFLPSIGAEYEFVNYNPLIQYSYIAENGEVKPLHPPVLLAAKLFARIYANKLEVYESNDLSIRLPVDAPCVNVAFPIEITNISMPVVCQCKPLPVLKSDENVFNSSDYPEPPRSFPFGNLPTLIEESEPEPPPAAVTAETDAEELSYTYQADNGPTENQGEGDLIDVPPTNEINLCESEECIDMCNTTPFN